LIVRKKGGERRKLFVEGKRGGERGSMQRNGGHSVAQQCFANKKWGGSEGFVTVLAWKRRGRGPRKGGN